MHGLGWSLAVLALFVAYNSYQYPMATILDPGPGWFPFYLSLTLLILSLLMILTDRDRPSNNSWSSKHLGALTVAVCCMSLAPWIGLWASSVVCIMIGSKRGTLLQKLVMSMISGTLLTVILVLGLGVALPILPEW